MKKQDPEQSKNVLEDEMRPEYDFASMAGGVRGKYYRAYREGYKVEIHKTDGTTEVHHFKPEKDAVILEPDVREYFPDSEAVNRALRGLITLLPEKRKVSGGAQRRATARR
jgi:hypothetical protein